jgi:hypothetical protein
VWPQAAGISDRDNNSIAITTVIFNSQGKFCPCVVLPRVKMNTVNNQPFKFFLRKEEKKQACPPAYWEAGPQAYFKEVP